MCPIYLRYAAPPDAPGLHKNCFYNQALAQVEEHVRWCLSEQEKGCLVCLVAELDGQAIACSQLSIRQDKGEIGSLIVAPAHRRQGIGTALVQALIQHARQRQLRTLEITANLGQPWIRTWYERLGFTFQREHDFPGERVAVLTMELEQGDPT